MGQIVFAAPGIARFHLHDRLQRELLRRGHRVATVFTDPAAHTFWRHQELASTLLLPTRRDPMRAPLAEIAASECARRGLPGRGPRHRVAVAHVTRQLAGLLPAMLRWFEATRPDLLLLHQDRSAVHALLQFVARELGTRVLWTGDGLLPHTLQCDERGLDGDASASRRHALDYRDAAAEPSLLQACLANLLGRSSPSSLARRELCVPPWRERLRDATAALCTDGFAAARSAWSDWRAALPQPEPEPAAFTLPRDPFVAVLLQAADDERVRLDATAPPTPTGLAIAAVAAAARLDERLHTVVVLPHRGLHHRHLTAIARLPRTHLAPAPAAPDTVATAVATMTVNHPLAVAALLAGTPVLHTGRALFGLPGVTSQEPAAAFADALPRALADDQPALRARFLSRLLGHGHLWCSSTQPDHNGLLGLVQELEARLDQRGATGQPLHYRAGPAWPLAAEGRGS